MTARKTAKKAAADPPKAKKKAAGKKKTTKKAAAKKPATKKASSKKETTEKAAPKKAASKKADAAEVTKSAEPKKKGSISSLTVNMGQVFALRPRVPKSFRQADFLTARDHLRDEGYASPEEAARAVVEKALELTRKPAKRGGGGGGKRR